MTFSSICARQRNFYMCRTKKDYLEFTIIFTVVLFSFFLKNIIFIFPLDNLFLETICIIQVTSLELQVTVWQKNLFDYATFVKGKSRSWGDGYIISSLTNLDMYYNFFLIQFGYLNYVVWL